MNMTECIAAICISMCALYALKLSHQPVHTDQGKIFHKHLMSQLEKGATLLLPVLLGCSN